MIVGVLSDTHGWADMATKAVAVLQGRGAQRLVHCGDVGNGDGRGTFVLDALAGTNATFVFGNNDYDADDLERYGNAIGVACLRFGGTLDVDGTRIAVTHGDNNKVVQKLLAPDNHADYLLTGHSHRVHDQKAGRTRCINPGALYRATVKTVALIDTAAGTVEWIEVADDRSDVS